MEVVVFTSLSLLLLASAAGAVLHRDPRAGLKGLFATILICCLLFVMLSAPRLAVFQLALYSIAIYLANRFLSKSENGMFVAQGDNRRRSWTRIAAGISILLFAGLLGALIGGSGKPSQQSPVALHDHSIETPDGDLHSDHLPVMIIAGLLVSIAAVGSSGILGRREDPTP